MIMLGRRLVLLGPPGSGKGTQGDLLSQRYGIPKISTGDMLRRMRDDPALGPSIRGYQDSGGLVVDEILFPVVENRLRNPDCAGGYIFDGFPRTLEQAKWLGERVDTVVSLGVPDSVLVERVRYRFTCEDCGAIYNTKLSKPKVEGKCGKEECCGELFQRPDDKPETVAERLKKYREKTEPLIDYYRKRGILKELKFGEEDVAVDVVFGRVVAAIES